MAPGAQGGSGLGCQRPAAQGYSWVPLSVPQLLWDSGAELCRGFLCSLPGEGMWGSEVAAPNSRSDSSNKKYHKGKYKNSLSIYVLDLPTPCSSSHS